VCNVINHQQVDKKPPSPVAVSDSACTHVLLHASSLVYPAVTEDPIHHPLTVSYPDGNTCSSTSSGHLTSNSTRVPVSFMPESCLSQQLVGLEPFTRSGHTATYDNARATIVSPTGQSVLTGTPQHGLWHLRLDQLDPHGPPGSASSQGNAALARRFRVVQEQVNYLQLLFGFRPTSTMVQMLRRGYIRAEEGWPVVTSSQYSTHAVNHHAINAGHLHEKRSHVDSTKAPASTVPTAPAEPDAAARQPQPAYLALRPLAGMHSDLKGPHPHASHQGHTHDLVTVFHNFIWAEPCRGTGGAAQAAAYRATMAYFDKHCAHPPPEYLRVDAAATEQVRQYFDKQSPKLRLEYVPPGCHRSNKAERAIEAWEMAVLSSTAALGAGFPASHWNELRPRIIKTLNHTRPSSEDPSISAWHAFHGERYNFNAHPLLPIGALIDRQIDADKRGSYGPKAAPAFALDSADESYRTQRILVRDKAGAWSIQREHQFDVFLPDTAYLHRIAPIEELKTAIQQLATALKRINTSAFRAAIGPTSVADLGASLIATAQDLLVDPPTPPVATSSHRSPTVQPYAPAEEQRVRELVAPAEEQRVRALVAPAAEQRVPESVLQAPLPVALSPAPLATPGVVPPASPLCAPPAPSHGSLPPLSTPLSHGLPAPPTTGDAPSAASPSSLRPHAIATAFLAAIACAAAAAPRPRPAPRTPPPSLAPKAPPPLRDPSTAANPALLHKLLEGSPLTPSEQAAWKSYLSSQHDPGADALRHVLSFDTPLNVLAEIAAYAAAVRVGLGFSAVTSLGAVLNLNPDGTPLQWRSASKGPHSVAWHAALAIELERLFDHDCWHAVHRQDLPLNTPPTYLSKAVKEKLKAGPDGDYVDRRVRAALDGSRIIPDGPTSCNTAETEVIKTFLNSVVSSDADFFTADVCDFYLGTPLPADQQVYVPVPAQLFSPESLDRRNLRQYIDKGQILLLVTRSIYGLRQAGRLSKERLDGFLAAGGYLEDELVPCVYRHASNGVVFCLVVDDFAVRHHGPAGKEHLLKTLGDAGYLLKIDHEGKKFVGLTIAYNRSARYIDISMPDYVPKMLKRFSHRRISPQPSPILYSPPVYGAKAQLTAPVDDSTTLSSADALEVQQIVGCGMWYARMTDSPTLTAVSILATEQAARRSSILPKVDRYLGHLMQQPSNVIRFHASDMRYYAYGDVSHNSVSHGRSRAGGYGFFGWQDDPHRLNGAVFTMSSVLDVVTSSACEGEYGAAYMVARNAVWIRTVARALGYPQGPTVILCDNTCAVGLASDTLKTAKTKAIDLRFHWLRDRVRQQQFNIVWVPSDANIADFFTKALPIHEHIRRLHQLVANNVSPVRNPTRALRSAIYRGSAQPKSSAAQSTPPAAVTKHRSQ
jgi:hypothetical protein